MSQEAVGTAEPKAGSIANTDAAQTSQDLNLTSLSRFAKFFKAYMGVMPVFMAALAPVLTLTKMIPVYDQQSRSLATYTGVLGFLAVAWVFYLRHPIARLTLKTGGSKMTAARISGIRLHIVSRGALLRFVMYVLPFFLVCASGYCYLTYNATVSESVVKTRILEIQRAIFVADSNANRPVPTSEDPSRDIHVDSALSVLLLSLPPTIKPPSVNDALADTMFPIPDSQQLMLYYLGIFLFAELAFFIMALREYLQSLLAISDQGLIEQPADEKITWQF